MFNQKIKWSTILSLVLLIVWLKPFGSVYAEEQVKQSDKPLLQFPVFSDIHIGGDMQQKNFIKALSDINRLAPNHQAAVFLGDLTNSGAEQQYNDFNRLLNTYGNRNAENIITIGNHEYFEGLYASSVWDPEIYQQRFVDKTGMPGLYYDKWINGYHFVALGSEGFPGNDTGDDDDYALISDEQYSWFENALAQNADPAKPIFVFLHQAIDHTVYGSEDWGGGFTDDRLYTILKQYPQVIFFSGHSHYILNHPRTIYQDGFTMVNAGSVAYGWTDLGYAATSQGLLVNVFNDRVEIKAREFTNNTDIQTFTVNTPYKKTYGVVRPNFKWGAGVNIDRNTSGESVTFSFGAASVDNSIVDRYIIKQDGKVIYTGYANYWDKPLSNKVTFEIKDLKPETNYDWTITAVDAWNNKSLTSLRVSFTTPVLNGWKQESGSWFYYENGKKATGWRLIGGKWYFLVQNGQMLTGWYSNGVNRYYLNTDGAMQTGWKTIDGKTYYFDGEGALKTGWVFDGGKWYFFDREGIMKLGWIYDGGKWYYLKSNGMVTGWLQDGGKWYYLSGSGAMQTGWIYNWGAWYYLSGSGAMQTGWVYTGNAWYYMVPSGEMKTGWLWDNGKWYYLKSSGAMQTGQAKIGNKWYYFYPDGSMA